ncbi:MAG: hypothetical protein ACK5RA_06410 [Cyanobacteriota bacterium]
MNPAIATTAFVLDNSVLCGWILANQATPHSYALAEAAWAAGVGVLTAY